MMVISSMTNANYMHFWTMHKLMAKIKLPNQTSIIQIYGYVSVVNIAKFK